MLFSSEVGARATLCSKKHFLKLMDDHGMEPVVRSPSGWRWSLKQILTIYLYHSLRRIAISDQSRLELAGNLYKGFTDESLEAALLSGRQWLMVVGNSVCPDLMPAGSIELVRKKRQKELAGYGLAIQQIDVLALWEDLRSMLKTVAAEVADDVTA